MHRLETSFVTPQLLGFIAMPVMFLFFNPHGTRWTGIKQNNSQAWCLTWFLMFSNSKPIVYFNQMLWWFNYILNKKKNMMLESLFLMLRSKLSINKSKSNHNVWCPSHHHSPWLFNYEKLPIHRWVAMMYLLNTEKNKQCAIWNPQTLQIFKAPTGLGTERSTAMW